MEWLIIVLVLFLLMGLDLPLAFCFGVAAFLSVAVLGMNNTFLPAVGYQALDNFSLTAVPFFFLAGDLMSRGGLSDRLIDLAQALVGRVRGGLGMALILACTLFGALSASASATVAAIGGVMIPRMEYHGWDRRYTSALAAASGWLGAMIPPSIVLILYGVVAQASIGALFLSTIIPGLILAGAYMVVNYFWSPKWRHETPQSKEFESQHLSSAERLKEIGRTGYHAIPALMVPVIILGGIYGGVFTATEAGAVACLYGFIAGTFILRHLKFKDIKASVYESAMLTATVFIILVFVITFARVLTLQHVPNMIADFLLGITDNKILLLLIINVIVLIAGMFVECGTLIMVITPLLLPTIISLDINLIHFGAFLTVNMGIGSISPPVAMSIFVACRVGNIPYRDIIRPLLPFLFFAAMPVLFLVTYVPMLSLWLPSIVIGQAIFK